MKITVKNLSKTYGSVPAVQDLSLDISDGELVCLLGPSGCGKSTTLSMIAGLEAPSEGQIFFDGKEVTHLDPEDRDIGMVFQNYALYPHMSVAENILFPLRMRRIPRAEQKRRLGEIARKLQITDLLRRKVPQLSGGQQQRVAIARALVKEPSILLLDEPLSNLDARLRIELRGEIRMLQKKLGITTIFVTHDQEEAMSISDRILLMDHGVLQQYATPQELYRNPANLFVAGFLGNPPMNRIPCICSGQTISVPDAPDWHLTALRPKCRGTVGTRAVLGIRPEDLTVCEKGHISAQICTVQTLGKEIYLNLKAGALPLTACLRWNRNYEVGEFLSFAIQQSYLFPAPPGEGGELK